MQTNPTSALSNFTWVNMVYQGQASRTNYSRSHCLGGVHRNKERRLMSELGLGRVKTFSCKRSELEEVATRAIFPDFDYALIAAISG